MGKNWIVGIHGRKTWREYYIDGKCVDCGKILSKDSSCFIYAEDKETLKKALKEDFYCFDCGLEHHKRESCKDCDERCATEKQREICYAEGLCEGEFACACPIGR